MRYLKQKKCKRVEEVNEHIRMLLDDMLDTLHNTKDGAAIAAPQVGILQRLVVIDMGNGVIKLINPEIIEEKGIQECVEGCNTQGERVCRARLHICGST